MCYSFSQSLELKRKVVEESDILVDTAVGAEGAAATTCYREGAYQDFGSKRRKLNPSAVIADSASETSSPLDVGVRLSGEVRLMDQAAAYDGEADDEKGAIMKPALSTRSASAAQDGNLAEIRDSLSTSDREVLVEDSQDADQRAKKLRDQENEQASDALDHSIDSGVVLSKAEDIAKNIDVAIARIKDEDEDSDLSDVAISPPPPNQELLELERHHELHKVECMHTTKCGCPMHASHEFGVGYPHLSEWALLSMESETSSERTTHPKLTKLETEEKTRRKDINRVSKSIIANLVEVQSCEDEDPNRLTHAAHVMVEQINIAFYNTPTSGYGLQKVLELVDRALKAWKKTEDFEKLFRRFGQAVEGRKDLMFKFQQFLPAEIRTVKIEEVKIRKMRLSDVKRRPSRRGRILREGRLCA